MKRASRRTHLTPWLAAAGAVLLWPALAASAVHVSLSGEAPFSATELDDAVRARVPDAPAPGGEGDVLVVVDPAGPNAVVVRAGDKTQVVEVGDRRGTAAARIVALVIADLMTQEIVPTVVTTRPEPREPLEPLAPAAPPESTEPDVDGAASAWQPGTLRIAAAAGASRGIGLEERFCFRAEVDVGRALVGGVVIGGALGLALIPTQNRGTGSELSYTAGVARIWAGWRAGALEVGAGPFVSPYTLGGISVHSGVLAGGGILARLVTPLSARVRLVVAARADGYLNRIHATWYADGGFATPRLDLALAAGLAWDAVP